MPDSGQNEGDMSETAHSGVLGAGWVPMEQALANKGARSNWAPRGAEGAVEPECWPQLTPGFRLTSGASVFTIGSCFARNIEQHLHHSGYRVPMLEQAIPHVLQRKHGNQVMNLYTPANIHQQVAWAHGILTRDDTCRFEDVERFIFPLADGHCLDLGLAGPHPGTPKELFERRQVVYQLFREAFFADCVVITLGLNECWYYEPNGIYAGNYYPRHFRTSLPGLYFKAMDFAESLMFIEQTLDMLALNGARPVLLTTSPVPLTRTFTTDDVIIANTYSKSVMRAVAGQLARHREGVEYFPSFENVMLTKQPYVWADDLKHVQDGFVGRIMQRVLESYGAQGDGGDTGPDVAQDQKLLLTDLVATGDLTGAREVLAALSEAAIASGDGDFQAALAHILAQDGMVEQARAAAKRHLEQECRDPLALVNLGTLALLPELRGKVWAVYEQRAEARPGLFAPLIKYAEGLGDFERARATAELAWRQSPHEMRFAQSFIRIERKLGGIDTAIAAAERALECAPGHAGVLNQMAGLLVAKKMGKEAQDFARRAEEAEPDNAVSYIRQAEALALLGDKEGALAALARGRSNGGDAALLERAEARLR